MIIIGGEFIMKKPNNPKEQSAYQVEFSKELQNETENASTFVQQAINRMYSTVGPYDEAEGELD